MWWSSNTQTGPPAAVPLVECVREAQRCSLEAFRDLFPEAAFIVEPFAVLPQEADFLTSVNRPVKENTSFSVVSLVKRPGSTPFPGLLTLGRANNNDIVLREPKVSRLHAFVNLRSGPLLLMDAGSSFGTFVDERRLARDERFELAPGSKVRLGGVRMTFYTPDTLHDYLQSLARRASQEQRSR